MADIRTSLIDAAGDLVVAGASLADDDGLQTAIVISLFSDARAGAEDALPGADDRRGWWGDTYAAVPGDRIGSRLWLLAREKQLPAVLARAEGYAREALQWLIDDGIARGVTVTASMLGNGVLGLQIEVVRNGLPVARYRFDNFWKGL